MIGQTLAGQYEIVRQLGSGGMGAVYEATSATQERVAIKVISTGDITKDKQLVTRFHREAKAAVGIDTDHIVRVLGTGTDPETDQPFMVMEYLVGEDLHGLFHRLGPLPPDLALRIMAQACVGLAKAHEAHVVHRDIKPANVFVAERPDGERIVKLLDFGIAKIKQDKQNAMDTTGLTRTGSMIGSPLYMSPEQARGSKTIDHRADIWSLGIVFYQALTGRTPNQDIEALGELIIAICSEPPRAIQEFAAWVPPEVAAIVHKTLRFDPSERYQTAGEMLEALVALTPGGTKIDVSMLVPMTDEAKAKVAQRISVPPPLPLSRSSGGRNSLAPSAALDALAKTEIEVPSAIRADGGTNEGLAQSPPSSMHQPPSLRLPIAIGVSAVAAIGLAFAYYATQSHANDVPELPSARPAFAEPAPLPTVATAVGTKTVSVFIVPHEATVEVEGKIVEVKNGTIEIAGKLGSVHDVRVTKGPTQTTTEVVITEAGALPAKIELAAASAKPSAGFPPRPPGPPSGVQGQPPPGVPRPAPPKPPPPKDAPPSIP